MDTFSEIPYHILRCMDESVAGAVHALPQKDITFHQHIAIKCHIACCNVYFLYNQ